MLRRSDFYFIGWSISRMHIPRRCSPLAGCVLQSQFRKSKAGRRCRFVVQFPKTFLSQVPVSSVSLPCFYGMPKIHKTPYKLRPIFAAPLWVTTKLSKAIHSHLQDYLNKLAAQGESHVVNSTLEFIRASRRWLHQRGVCIGHPTSGIYATTMDFQDLYMKLDRDFITS